MQICKEKQDKKSPGRHVKRFIFCSAKLSKTFTPTPIEPGSHLCNKHNTSDVSTSISTRKKEHCAYACAYVACVMLIAQV